MEVGVYCFESVVVAYDNIIAVSVAFVVEDANFSGEGCSDCVACVKAEVNAVVESVPTGAEV